MGDHTSYPSLATNDPMLTALASFRSIEVPDKPSMGDHNAHIMTFIAEAFHADLVQNVHLWRKELGRARIAIERALDSIEPITFESETNGPV